MSKKEMTTNVIQASKSRINNKRDSCKLRSYPGVLNPPKATLKDEKRSEGPWEHGGKQKQGEQLLVRGWRVWNDREEGAVRGVKGGKRRDRGTAAEKRFHRHHKKQCWPGAMTRQDVVWVSVLVTGWTGDLSVGKPLLSHPPRRQPQTSRRP